MTGRGAASTAIRIAAIVALIGVGLAIALMAWHERIPPHSDNHLRIAIALLLVSAAAMVLVAVLVARSLQPAS